MVNTFPGGIHHFRFLVQYLLSFLDSSMRTIINISEVVKNYFRQPLLDLLYPQVCWLCNQLIGGDQQIVCRQCLNKLIPFRFQADSLKMNNHHYDQVHILYEFEDTVRMLIHLLKYKNCKGLAHIFAREADNRFSGRWSKAYACVTAVPLHLVRQRERGYNQSALLAEHLAGCIGLPYSDSLIQRTRFTSSQTKLSRVKRRANVASAFAAVKILHYDRILLVDDVVTTGSTVDACARVLKETGVKTVDVFALANPILGDDHV